MERKLLVDERCEFLRLHNCLAAAGCAVANFGFVLDIRARFAHTGVSRRVVMRDVTVIVDRRGLSDTRRVLSELVVAGALFVRAVAICRRSWLRPLSLAVSCWLCCASHPPILA